MSLSSEQRSCSSSCRRAAAARRRTRPRSSRRVAIDAHAPGWPFDAHRKRDAPVRFALSLPTVRQDHDYDWLVIGSGFGGSVAALRLSEKGHRVAVLECGRRFGDDELPRSTWDLRRYFYAPRLGMRGIFRLSTFRDVAVVSGAGVGGGSLGYANTLYRAPRRFYEDGAVGGARRLGGRAGAALRRGGADARRGGGRGRRPRRPAAARVRPRDRRRRQLRQDARRRLLRRAGRHGARPLLRRRRARARGLRRAAGAAWSAARTTPRTRCPRTTSGWPSAPARRSSRSTRSSTCARVGAPDGSEGYEVTTERPGAWLRRERTHAAGARRRDRRGRRSAPTSSCSAASAHGSLPRVSDRLGRSVRTNSEAILAVTLPKEHADLIKRVAITSSVYPDPDTHIETVTYGDAGDSMSLLYTLMVGDGTRVTRPLKLLGTMLRHPLKLLRTISPRGWSRRTIIVLVMQTLDNAISLRAQARRCAAGSGCRPSRTPSGRTRRSSRSPTTSPRGSPSARAGSPRARSWRRRSTSRAPPTSSAAP